jgi:ABC-type multidrug transport system ATPase subunit
MLRAEPATRPEPGRAEWGPSAPDPGPIVEVRGLSKRFPVRRSWKETVLHPRSTEFQEALVDVDLHVRRGEFFGLLGRNGAGKTTLFKILATLVLADEGEARVRGLDVAREPDAVRRTLVPVLPYERSLYWRLTARENLRLYAALHNREYVLPDDVQHLAIPVLAHRLLPTADAQIGQRDVAGIITNLVNTIAQPDVSR